MREEQLVALYHAWQVYTVAQMPQYESLFEMLDDIVYAFSNPSDGNRYEDGVGLRYKFAYDNTINYAEVAALLDTKPCTVLEMILAIACKMENMVEQPSFPYEFVPKYLNVMLRNLEIATMTNDNINKAYVEFAINKFINRLYDPITGRGSLFPNVSNLPNYNHRDIWSQCMHYLTFITREREILQ